MDFDIFGRNVTDKVGNQKTTMPPQITCASTLPGNLAKRENTKITFLFFSQLDCEHYTHNAPVRCLPERKKFHL